MQMSRSVIILIQNTQNRDGAAIQIKLDELIRVHKEARDELLALEHCSDEELDRWEAQFEELRRKRRHLRHEGPLTKAGEAPHSKAS